MKLGIMKLGATITWSQVSKTAANFDVHSIVGCLKAKDQKGDYDLTVITRKTRNTKIPKDLKFAEIEKIDINTLGLDALLVFNGNVNFFGGAEAPDQIMNYVHMNNFKGPVIYVQTDGQLQLTQIWPAMWKKDWSSNWAEDLVTITRDDIIYLTQARDIDKVYSLTHSKNSVPVKKENIHHFPIEQAIMCKPVHKIKQHEKEFDLIYGGAIRGGQRKKLLTKYYFGLEDNNVCLFGAMKEKDFPVHHMQIRPQFRSKVNHSDFMSAMTKGKATCIIGDEWYSNNMHTLRIYETILANVVCFVSTEFDANKTIFNNAELNDFLYVSSKKELNDKLRTLTDERINYLVKLQIESINFDRNSYFDRLHASLSGILRKNRD